MTIDFKPLLARFNAMAGWKIMAGVLVVFLLLTAFFNDLGQRHYAAIKQVDSVRGPYMHIGNNEPTKIALTPGQTYFINYKVSLHSICERTIIQNRLIMYGLDHGRTIDGEKVNERLVYWNYPIAWGAATTPGTYEFNEMYSLPIGLPPGQYTHERIFFTTCNGYQTTSVFPPVTFTVKR